MKQSSSGGNGFLIVNSSKNSLILLGNAKSEGDRTKMFQKIQKLLFFINFIAILHFFLFYFYYFKKLDPWQNWTGLLAESQKNKK